MYIHLFIYTYALGLLAIKKTIEDFQHLLGKSNEYGREGFIFNP